MVIGRSLESKVWSLESSQRARRVSIRSSISSISTSDFAVAATDEEDDDSAISTLFFLCSQDRITSLIEKIEQSGVEKMPTVGIYRTCLVLVSECSIYVDIVTTSASYLCRYQKFPLANDKSLYFQKYPPILFQIQMERKMMKGFLVIRFL